MNCIRCNDNKVVLTRKFLEWSDNLILAYCVARNEGQSQVEATKAATIAFPGPPTKTQPCPECCP